MLALARRAKAYNIVPEFSFVLGTPPDPLGDVPVTFEFIRRIKAINPASEIVLYTYTPVVADGALAEQAAAMDFTFPQTLDDFAAPAWPWGPPPSALIKISNLSAVSVASNGWRTIARDASLGK